MAAGSDGSHTFTFDTVSRRLPAIVRSTIAANGYAGALAADLERLAAEIAAGAPLVALTAPALLPWNAHAPMADALARRETWISAPWFLVENYMYKRIWQLTNVEHAAATGARRPGSAEPHDPFLLQKEAALHASDGALLESILPLFGSTTSASPDSPPPASIAHFVYRSLWGNRADLSISAGDGARAVGDALHAERGGGGGSAGGAARGAQVAAPPLGARVSLEQVRDGARLLCDDAPLLVAALAAPPPTGAPGGARLVVVCLDNAGLELLTDLALAAALLVGGQCDVVELVAKDAPTFVSDALPADVAETVGYLRAHASGDARALARTLDTMAADGRLLVSGGAEPFCTSPCGFWQMPRGMAERWCGASAVLLKGDANYRRLLGDAHWPHATPPAAALSAEWPAAGRTFCLRTCKSEVLVGVSAERAAAAAAESAAWLTAGTYGVVQRF